MSTKYDVAHFQEQGEQIIAVFVHSSFGQKPSTEQNEICASLQACAKSAGLAGTVVPVWDSGGGRSGFLAPQQWHGFFGSVSLVDLAATANRTLTCG